HVARADYVHGPAALPVALGAGNVGVGGGVDDDVRPYRPGRRHDGVGVGDVELGPRRRVHADALRPFQQPSQLASQAAAAAREEQPHPGSGSLTAARRNTNSVAASPPTSTAAATVTPRF